MWRNVDDITLGLADAVYSCSSSCKIKRQKIVHDKLQQFSHALFGLEEVLREEKNDDVWKAFLRKLKRYRFQVCAAPLPLNCGLDSESLQFLNSQFRRISFTHPRFVPLVRDLLELVTKLSETDENPILDATLSLSDKTRMPRALLVKEAYLIPLVRKYFEEQSEPTMDVLNPFQMRSAVECYEQLIVIGPFRWFPDYLFSAPRSRSIHIITYSFTADTWKPTSTFINPHPHYTSAGIQISFEEPASNDEEEQDVLPIIDWTAISSRVSFTKPHEDSYTEDAVARLFLLEPDFAVFLDANGDSRVMVIHPDFSEADDNSKVEKLLIVDLEPGMFILLRTGGGGDYIAQVADRLLGNETIQLRRLQHEWKSVLRSKISEQSLFAVSIGLLDCGSLRANEINVRNWASTKNIRPDDDKDFFAVLKYTGLGDKAKSYFEAARKIDSAHRSAGHVIRESLLEQVENADVRELETLGIMEFDLPAAVHAHLTAFRIKAISPSTFTISYFELNHVFHAEE